QDHGADRITFQVQRQPVGVVGEFQHLEGHGIAQAVNADDAVRHGDDGTFGSGFGDAFEVLDALPDDLTDFGRIELHYFVLLAVQGRGHAFQAPADRTVNDQIPCPDHGAAQQTGIGFRREVDLPV